MLVWAMVLFLLFLFLSGHIQGLAWRHSFRESGVSWGRRGRGVGGARGASGASAWRRRERLAQSRRPMEILTSLYALLSGGQGVNPKIDSVAFRLHCGATTAALLAASAALTTRHLVGNPIDCIHTRDIPEDVLNTYCWIHSTFTVAGEAGAYPGVRGAGTSPRRYGKYYQWVAFMLFLQGVKKAPQGKYMGALTQLGV
ncbi:uncharacterized protein LOC123864748 [Maniola jurtina]|uniref:uncharacterized protein LOC123864748 n=1 Tax=Maniola jurtina TaxID=191418 RepID=UPI001E68B4BF|nr:uncharacterized protein LOC123864748 [Maniola jurtina]